VGWFNSHGRSVVFFLFDNEEVFKCISRRLNLIGINVGHTPTDMHNKTIERYIQTVFGVVRSIRYDLNYVSKVVLEGELLGEAISSTNNAPNSKTGPTMTPFQAVTGVKPVLRPYAFGEIGLCNSKRVDNNVRAEWCIFIGIMYNCIKHIKVYMPQWNKLYSRRVFIPQKYNGYSNKGDDVKDKYKDAIMNSTRNSMVQLGNGENDVRRVEVPNIIHQPYEEAEELMISEEEPEESK
jgi:hypothetical protein